MAFISSTPNPVFVDRSAGETVGTTRIKYSKAPGQELFERLNSTTWTIKIVDNDRGEYQQTLKPGDTYQVGVFWKTEDPAKADPLEFASTTIVCLWNKSQPGMLLADFSMSVGGTWSRYNMNTRMATSIALIACSRKPVVHAGNSFPKLNNPVSSIGPLPVNSTFHSVEVAPLLAGQEYFFAAVIYNSEGDWEVVERNFTTRQRKLTIQFKKLRIIDSGDVGLFGGPEDGEARFHFAITTGPSPRTQTLDWFDLPEQDVSNNQEVSLGFAHIGLFESVVEDTVDFSVYSNGIEDDSRSSGGQSIFTPYGSAGEAVNNQIVKFVCRDSNDEFKFVYEVFVVWSAEYR